MMPVDCAAYAFVPTMPLFKYVFARHAPQLQAAALVRAARCTLCSTPDGSDGLQQQEFQPTFLWCFPFRSDCSSTSHPGRASTCGDSCIRASSTCASITMPSCGRDNQHRHEAVCMALHMPWLP